MDCEYGLEATLSGQRGIVADLMRDVSEIELLLLDFSLELDRIVEWLSANRRERLRNSSPAEFANGSKRRRVTATIPLRADYAAHSEALHVTPQSHPCASREPPGDSWLPLTRCTIVSETPHETD